MLAAAACTGDKGADGMNGANGANGSNGANGTNGTSSLVNVTAEPAGANCANGGERIDTGVDANGNGVLDASEITNTSYVCNGSTGDQTLVTTTPEPAGSNCADGGLRVDVGVDDNGNGVLDASEIDSTSYVCNGTSPAADLIAMTTEPAGANCTYGGQRIDTGADTNGNNTLDASEVTSTAYVCSGAPGQTTLVSTATIPPGAVCATGGVEIDVGIDSNSNNTLDASEVSSTQDVCNGTTGLQSLIKVTAEPSGANCGTGGERVDVGIDDNRNGTLDTAEIDSTAYVCNGANGTNASNSARYLYLANWAAQNTNFDVYDVAANTWSSKAPLPSASRGQITSLGSTVTYVGVDNNVYIYDILTNAWRNDGPGPNLSGLSFFEAQDGKLFACTAQSTTLNIRTAGTWSTLTLPFPCSVAGGVDPVQHEIYVKKYGDASFTVVSSTTNTVVRTINDTTGIGENTSSAAYYGGKFYVRSGSGDMFSLDSVSGTRVDTGVDPGELWPGFTTDAPAHVIYIKGQNTFHAYDPVTNTLKSLAGGPTSQSTLATITTTY